MIVRRIIALGVLLAMIPVNAFAAASKGEEVGQNLGNLLGSWGKALFITVAGLISIKFLFERKFADLAVFVIALVVVGGLVYSQGDVAVFIRGIWNSLTA